MTVTKVSAQVTVCLDQTLNPSKGLRQSTKQVDDRQSLLGRCSTTGPPSVAHQASTLSASNSHTGGVHGGMTAHRSAACTAFATQAAMASGEQPSSAAVRAAVAAATATVAVVAFVHPVSITSKSSHGWLSAARGSACAAKT